MLTSDWPGEKPSAHGRITRRKGSSVSMDGLERDLGQVTLDTTAYPDVIRLCLGLLLASHSNAPRHPGPPIFSETQ